MDLTSPDLGTPLMERTSNTDTPQNQVKENRANLKSVKSVTFASLPTTTVNGTMLKQRQPARTSLSEFLQDPSLRQIRDPVISRSLAMRIRFRLESLPFRVFMMILVTIDLITLCVVLAMGKDTTATQTITWMILSAYVFELVLRILVTVNFWTHPLDVFDAMIVVLSVLFQIVQVSVGSRAIVVIRFLRFARFFRGIRVVVYTHNESKRLVRAARRHVSENKRRFFLGAVELDLTYITDRVIAMSLPAVWIEALYRNSIADVATYFNTTHGNQYRIYNLCAERNYNTTKFEGTVVNFPVADHNVASLENLVKFCNDAQEFMKQNPENVIAVHCRGGKGRTGLFICSWLLHGAAFRTAKESLDFFASRRTDESLSTRFQGVQTPSQYRYVGYYERLVNEFKFQIPHAQQKYRINAVRVFGLAVDESLDAMVVLPLHWLSLRIFCAGALTWDTAQRQHGALVKGRGWGCSLEFIFSENAPVVSADTKFQFLSKAITLPKAYDKCLLYFWLHLGMEHAFTMPTPRGTHVALVPRDLLDNGHFKKNRKALPDQMHVEVEFSPLQTEP